ncbi:hypothetical protein AZE42_10692 [Rhizopogon vesiculosus]|uniref:CxC2-like cysteine cluster KDZ transposase-associated domain-containing protein n=1 Tax=Rhizopogon vesiculosus TaxID=180088 RepID=A0A1J8Q8B0_9AGAM|nr:hypothetical protein AZE42_10692 [Rhizopogon vesiculosus]
MGLHVQLGHHLSEKCYNPQPSSSDDFVVIDVHGVHEIALDFCGSASAQIRYKQLLRTHWYPATTSDPRTVATFTLLEHFHVLSFESKVSAYEFYHSLARRNNNAGLLDIRDRYSAFMHMVHEWRHLRQLRHAGRGHDSAGVNATTAGELVVQCPACPHPGKNILQGWEDKVPLSLRWKYALFIAIDANFRLKWKAVSSDNVDLSLNSVWVYFVVTQSVVCLQLAELEAHELEAGTNVSLHTDISPSRLITTGIDLQDQQQCLKLDIANASLHPTDKQKTTLQTHITTLQRRLDAWAHIQELYMPAVSQLHH